MEDEEVEHAQVVQQHSDQDGDSAMEDDDGVEYEEDYGYGQYTEEALDGYEGYSDESGSTGISNAQPIRQPPPATKQQQQPQQQATNNNNNNKKAGNTEDDAIELSD